MCVVSQCLWEGDRAEGVCGFTVFMGGRSCRGCVVSQCLWEWDSAGCVWFHSVYGSGIVQGVCSIRVFMGVG